MRHARMVCVVLAAVLTAGVAWGQPAPSYDVNSFDVYKYSTDGTPVPDVDKVVFGDPNDLSCWEACAANLLAAAGYGLGAPGGATATAQARGDYIYGQLTTDLGKALPGYGEQAINYWLYTYGKNPDNLTGDYMPNNGYTDVTAVRRNLVLVNPANPAVNDYNFLLDELKRCQYVGVSFKMLTGSEGHALTLVGGNYWSNPSANQSIWHDSDRDKPDNVVTTDDDVYINAPDPINNVLWTLQDYPTSFATGYITLCPGLNKPQYAVENYDVAYYRSDTDKNGVWDPVLRTAGKHALNGYQQPEWYDNTIKIGNEEMLLWEKDVYLLVDYIDRVPGRETLEHLFLSAIDPNTGVLVVLSPTSVTASDDNGQLLFYWDLDFQPAWEDIVFPDGRYKNLYDPSGVGPWSDVKDWNIATFCEIPEPTSLTLMTLALLGAGWMRRRMR